MPITGTFSNAEGPVLAGLDVLIFQDSQLVTFASGFTWNEDFELEGIRTLGVHGDRFFKSLGYTGNCDIDTYVLRGSNVPGALLTAGWQADGTFNLNTAGSADFAIIDVDTLTVLYTLLLTKLSTQSSAAPARGLMTKTTNWRFARALPGLNSS